MKLDHRSYRCNFCSCEKKAEVKGLNPVQTWILFFQAFFSQLQKHNCVYNCNDLLSYNSSACSSHIWFSLFVYSNFNKNTLIQLIFLCCYILVTTCTCTWSIKLSDYLSFNLVAFFPASLYGSNTNSARPIFKQSNIPLYQLGYL